MSSYRETLEGYLKTTSCHPLFICGDALEVLTSFPPECLDFCMTSPPYWNKREYHDGGIGLEESPDQYMENLLSVFGQVKREPCVSIIGETTRPTILV